MSMISKQCERLRERAESLRQGPWQDGPDDAEMMEDAADTIWLLRNEGAENARLREQIMWLMKGDILHVITEQEYIDQQRHEREMQASIVALVDENAKLRELVSDMWRFTGTACKKYPRLFDPSTQGGQMVHPNALKSLEQRMRELGIEVDE